MSEHCYHCGLPVPPSLNLTVIIDNKPRSMCCGGCQAVAQAIVDAGLTDFYTYRTETQQTAQSIVPDFLQQMTVYDNPNIQKRFVQFEGEHIREAALILEGITCAACLWLNEKHLRHLKGVLDVQVNYSNRRARVRWDNQLIQLSDILQAVSQIGYTAHPYDPARQQQLLERERHQQLRRMSVAGLMAMQIMMISFALYAGDWFGIETEFKVMFYWINLILTIPIMLYCAEPFFKSAWRDLQRGQAGMDVSVSLGILLAFIGSVWTTLKMGEIGQVYYDSISMFVFLLLTGRYFELMARQRSIQAAETLVHLVPTITTRLRQGQEESVLVADLLVGDVILIRPGETIPVDGTVLTGHSSVDESLLTGESMPLPKQTDQNVMAGTINVESPLEIRVDKVGSDTVLSHILRLLDRAQTEKPAITQLADRVASWFVFGVILLSVVVALYWWYVNPTVWLSITLSVLVVTCPCALSLATPTAITAATSTLTRSGLLITRGHALETLAHATHFIFDKTGTLTVGQLRLVATHALAQWDRHRCLAHAVALERFSEHPIAQALIESQTSQANQEVSVLATEVVNQPGAGLQGKIAGVAYFVGTPAFITEKTGLCLAAEQWNMLPCEGHTVVLLADSHTIYALFVLADQIRTGAGELIQALQQQGKTVLLLSGDHPSAVRHVADAVGIQTYSASLSPGDKLTQVKALQAQGAIVAMVGDGVNDAPVLAQAQISIAMGSGTQIARASADMILLSEQLLNLLVGIRTAERTLVIIRQNLAWAIGYNVIALPAAAMGWIAPWAAAIGMSFSSLLVVGNALRLVIVISIRS